MTTLVVTQLWGDAILDVARVPPRGSFDAAGRPLLEKGLLRCDDEDARVELDGASTSLRTLVAGGDALAGADGAWRYEIPLGARAFVPRHGVVFRVERVPSIAPVPAERLKHIDRAFAGVLASVLFFVFSASLAARVLGLLGYFPVAPGATDLARESLPVLRLVLDTPAPVPPAPPRVVAVVKPGGEPDAGAGSKPRGEEGARGTKDGVRRQTKGGAHKTKTDKEVANATGVLGAMKESGRDIVALIGRGPLSGGANDNVGMLYGDTRADMRGPGGLGLRGDKKGGGGDSLNPSGWGPRGRGPGGSGGGDKPGNLGPRGNGREAKIDIGGEEVLVFGSLDPSVIDGVIKRHLEQIQYCYQRQLGAKPGLHGKLVVNFTIESDGRVSQARMKSSTMGDAVVEECVADRFAKIRFPHPKGGGTVAINYPLLFKSTGN